MTTRFQTVLLCLYVADPATFLASNGEDSLFIQLWKKTNISVFVFIITSLILEILESLVRIPFLCTSPL